jgi:hypothetical protein
MSSIILFLLGANPAVRYIFPAKEAGKRIPRHPGYASPVQYPTFR